MSQRRSKKNKRGNNQIKDNLFITRVPSMKDYAEAIAPPRKLVMFKHNALGVLAAASSTASKRWYANSVYQPQVGTSGSVSGFTYWSNFYARYRVIEFGYRVTLVNNMNEGTSVGIYVGSADPGVSAGMTPTRQPLGKSYLLSATGGQDRHTFRGKFVLTELYGEANITSDYQSTISTNPADLLYFAICTQSSSGVTLTAGISYEIELTYWTEFFARNNLT